MQATGLMTLFISFIVAVSSNTHGIKHAGLGLVAADTPWLVLG
jgi:hypothetical protein